MPTMQHQRALPTSLGFKSSCLPVACGVQPSSRRRASQPSVSLEAHRSSFGAGTNPSSLVRPAAARRQVVAMSASSNSPYPFREEQFHRVQFVQEPYGPMRIYQDPRTNVQFTGVMVFKRCQDSNVQKNLKIMEVFVAGDTAVNIYTLVNNQQLERPMVHDVMWSIMQQAQAGDPRRWQLLRVAVVGLQNDVFVGRLFFGDPLTQTVYWDCDCRPSDGCYLSIKCNAPLFVHQTVWDSAAKLVEQSTVHQMLLDSQKEGPAKPLPQPQAQQKPGQQKPASAAAEVQQPPANHDYMTLLQDDFDAIKLLKRKLAVAIKEENYKAATQIRDHPFMILYKDMFTSRLLGLQADAVRYETELKRQIEATEAPDRGH